MDIKKAMNFLKNTVTRDSGFSPVFIANMDILIGYVEKQLTDRWIPVSEKLPEHNKHVLLFLRNSEGKEIQVVGYLYFSEKEELKAYNNEFSVFDGGDMPDFLIQRYVKAWRELPEEYKGE